DEVAFFNRALNSAEVTAQFNAASGANYSSTVQGQAPIAYYRLNETSGNVAADSSDSPAYHNDAGIGNQPLSATSGALLYSTPPTVTITVVNTADSGPGSLRQAILDANALMDPVAVTINFNIPSTDPGFVDVDATLPGGDAAPDVFVIRPLTALPTLTK